MKKKDPLGTPRLGLSRSVGLKPPRGLALGSCSTYSARQPSGAKGHIPMPLLLETSQTQSEPLIALPVPHLNYLRFGLRGNSQFQFPAGSAPGQFTVKTYTHSGRWARRPEVTSCPCKAPCRLPVNRDGNPHHHPTQELIHKVF